MTPYASLKFFLYPVGRIRRSHTQTRSDLRFGQILYVTKCASLQIRWVDYCRVAGPVLQQAAPRSVLT